MITVGHDFDDQGRAVGIAVYKDGLRVAVIPRDATPHLVMLAAQVLQRR